MAKRRGDERSSSTTVSLSTAVPRPVERRDDERVSAMLRVGKLTTARRQQLIRIKNLSAGGLMAIIAPPPRRGPWSTSSCRRKDPGRRGWTRDDLVGLKFDQNLDLGELLAGRKPRHGFRPRPPRLEIDCGPRSRSARSITASTCTTFRLAE